MPNTLLGVDVVRDGKLLAADADEQRLLQILANAPGPAHILVTGIGGQGHLFGRGNQQFSPAVIRAVGLDNITIVAAKSKMAGLGADPCWWIRTIRNWIFKCVACARSLPAMTIMCSIASARCRV